jgi:hypothetical protein
MHCGSQVVRLICLVGVFLGGITPIRADEEPKTVRVTVVAVLASKSHNQVDRNLKDFAKELQKKDPTLTGFKLELMTSKSIKVGHKETFPLIEGQTIWVLVRERDDKSGCVSLTIKPPTWGEIEYTCCCGKFFPVITKHVTQNKEILIIAVMSKPCSKK